MGIALAMGDVVEKSTMETRCHESVSQSVSQSVSRVTRCQSNSENQIIKNDGNNYNYNYSSRSRKQQQQQQQ